MANLISYASGNLTGASTWKLTETGTGAASTTVTTNVTSTTTSYVNCPQFTITNSDVIEGVMFHCRRLTTTGTVTVGLFNDSVSTTVAEREVVINASDLPVDLTWVFFAFGTTITGDGGTDYRVGVKGSSAGNASFARASATAADWCKLLRRDTTATAAAGDNLFVVGQWTAAATGSDYTVTMDSTAATDYGQMDIGQRGTLTWGTTAATAYILQLSGNLNVWAGGAYNQGTVATPMPRDSTATLQLDCASDGQYGLQGWNGSTLVLQGQSRTSGKDVDRCKLNTDEAIASTALGVDTDTGWLDNDRIAIASTSRTATECETGTLNGNAGASSLTVDGFAGAGGGLAFAHSGTSPTQAEIILLTRNVVVRSVSSTNMAYVYMAPDADYDCDWVEFRYLGENATTKRGIELATTTGTVTIDYCSISDCEDGGLYLSGATLAGVLAVNDLVMYNCPTVTNTSAITVSGTTGAPVLNDAWVIRSPSTTACVVLSDFDLSCDGLLVAGASGIAVSLQEAAKISHGAAITNITAHSSASYGLNVSGPYGHVDGLIVWRNANMGISASAAGTLIKDVTAFGNSTATIFAQSGSAVFDGISSNGDSTFSTTYGIYISATNVKVEVINGDFSTASGIRTAHTTDFIMASTGAGEVIFSNSKTGAATPFSGNTLFVGKAGARFQRFNQTDGDHRGYFRNGIIRTDATIYNTASPSERLTPNKSTEKLESGSRFVAVDDAGTKTISVYVRKSQSGDGAQYNGNQPRLVVKRNDALGITSDTVLDTMTAAVGSWEQLSGTTATATDDGAFEVVVDCDGTAGWVNVDDWSVS